VLVIVIVIVIVIVRVRERERLTVSDRLSPTTVGRHLLPMGE
jgi:hypothetical protein